MPKYKVSFKKSALKELHKLHKTEVVKIVSLIKKLSDKPRPKRCKKLKGFANFWRVRSGNYRIIYSIEDQILIVEILKIADRKDAYE